MVNALNVEQLGKFAVSDASPRRSGSTAPGARPAPCLGVTDRRGAASCRQGSGGGGSLPSWNRER